PKVPRPPPAPITTSFIVASVSCRTAPDAARAAGSPAGTVSILCYARRLAMTSAEKTVAVELAEATGAMLRQELGRARRVEAKDSPINLVTEMDRRGGGGIGGRPPGGGPGDASPSAGSGARGRGAGPA